MLCVSDVPKKKAVECMNDLRPVALTSVAMRVCEKIFLKKRHATFGEDPCQFVYRKARSLN